MNGSDEPSDDDGEAEETRGPSRTQARREATAVRALGLRLVGLRPAELERIALEPELREAIEACRQLSKGALVRQKRLIGKLLRSSDHAAILAALERASSGRRDGYGPAEHAAETWRQRLFEGGDAELQAFVAQYPTADRPHLRQLLRNATRVPESPKARRAARDLLQAIAEARSAAVAEADRCE